MLNSRTKELLLSGPVNLEMYRRLFSATEKLRSNGKKPTIILNTEGGDFYQGLAIYDWIRTELSNARILSVGPVMSAGMIILQAGEERIALENTQFMIHYGEEINNSGSSKKHNERLNNLHQEILMKRSNLDKRKINKMFDTDTFLTAQEALELGLIDYIIGLDDE